MNFVRKSSRLYLAFNSSQTIIEKRLWAVGKSTLSHLQSNIADERMLKGIHTVAYSLAAQEIDFWWPWILALHSWRKQIIKAGYFNFRLTLSMKPKPDEIAALGMKIEVLNIQDSARLFNAKRYLRWEKSFQNTRAKERDYAWKFSQNINDFASFPSFSF